MIADLKMRADKAYIEKYVKNGIENYLISSSMGFKEIDNDVEFIILKVKKNIPPSYENALHVIFHYQNQFYRVILDKSLEEKFNQIDNQIIKQNNNYILNNHDDNIPFL